jgi:hypothetical protein
MVDKDRLADGGRVQRRARARTGEGAHHLPTFDLREIDGLAVVLDREVHGLARAFHQEPHMRPCERPESATFGEGRAGHERLHANRPQPPFLVEAHIPLLLEGGEEAVGGGSGQAHLLGKLGQPSAFAWRLGNAVQERERPDKRLHLIAGRRGLSGRLGANRNDSFRNPPSLLHDRLSQTSRRGSR